MKRYSTSWLPLVCLHAAGLVVLPASAQVTVPVSAPAAEALTPLQGAEAVLDHAHNAKSMAALNGDLTNESAASLGLNLVLTDSVLNGISSTMMPKGAVHQEAVEKAFQNKVVALLNRYSLTDKAMDASEKPGNQPTSLVLHGHQFLTDAVALNDTYEKSHPPNKGNPSLSYFEQSDFPASNACTFSVLSPTHVQIVARLAPDLPIEANLEDGRWRLAREDLSSVGGGAPVSPRPEIKLITPQAAVFLKSIQEEDVAEVEKQLKANPSLANSPVAFKTKQTPSVTHLPLSLTAFIGNIQIAGLLLKYGAKVNAEEDFHETTALDEAARFSNKGVAALLLAHGADIAHRDENGQTALHRAVLGNNPGTVSLMLAYGAAVNARDQDGKTPLDLALEMPGQNADKAAILSLLRRHGAEK